MPEKLEKELRSRGRALGFKGDRLRRYIYGTLRKTGWKPSREKGAAGLLARKGK